MLNIILKKYFSAPSIHCCAVSSWSPEVLHEGTFAPSEMEDPFAPLCCVLFLEDEGLVSSATWET